MRFKPLFYARCKLQLRIELRKQGKLKLAELVDNDLIDAAAESDEAKQAMLFRELGDGSIIARIIEWFRSPEGKAFIELLLKILLGVILDDDN